LRQGWVRGIAIIRIERIAFVMVGDMVQIRFKLKGVGDNVSESEIRNAVVGAWTGRLGDYLGMRIRSSAEDRPQEKESQERMGRNSETHIVSAANAL